MHAQLNEHFATSSSSSSSSDKAVTHSQEALDITHLLLQLVRILSTVGLPSASQHNIAPFNNSNNSNGDDDNHSDENKWGDNKFSGGSIGLSGEGNNVYGGVASDNNDVAVAATVALRGLVRAVGVYLRHHRYLYHANHYIYHSFVSFYNSIDLSLPLSACVFITHLCLCFTF